MEDHFQIEIVIEGEVPAFLPQLLEKTIIATLQQEQVMLPAQLSLLLTGDETLQKLNASFLGIDKVTDVLSFPAGELMPGMKSVGEVDYLGDIALALPQAARQAEVSGHDLAAECQLLVVHAVLHLLGYEHGNDVEKAEMWATQAMVLHELKVRMKMPA